VCDYLKVNRKLNTHLLALVLTFLADQIGLFIIKKSRKITAIKVHFSVKIFEFIWHYL